MQSEVAADKGRVDLLVARGLDLVEHRWRLLVLAIWLGLSAYFLFENWGRVRGFALGDTDDNMRMAQVRALLAGQDWFDLRQYKLSPPFGINIHWSRIPDLPIAALILLARPLVGGADAERFAAAVAPLLPLLPMLFAVSLTARRLIAPTAYPLAIIALFFCGSTLGMVSPTRIDHHGWQLALLAVAVSGMTDPRRARGGATTGLAAAISLSIGLESLIYIALLGGAVTLFWVTDREERRRLAAYAVSLGGGCALGFAGFASYANRLPLCDALSPVWLSNALIGGALLLGLSMLRVETWQRRLMLAIGAGMVLAACHALMWPHCLSRLEGVSPEVHRLWLSRVREARPVWANGWQVMALMLAMPVAGLAGYLLLGWRARGDADRLRKLLAVAAPALAAALLLGWQTRTGPAAQLLAVPGAAALPFLLAPRTFNAGNSVLRVVGTTLIALFGFGALIPLGLSFVPNKPATAREQAVNRANRLCPTLGALKPVAQQPKGIVFTFVDLAPRLINVTHHSSITGPYHRNGDAIRDVMHAFRGNADGAEAIVRRYRSDYLLICPNLSQATVFMAEAPKGFYGQLARGQVPAWLQPIALPKGSPYRMYRVLP